MTMASDVTAGGAKCGHCGARIEVPPGTPATRCQYCGTPFDARASSAPPPGYGAPPQGGPPGYGPPPGGSGYGPPQGAPGYGPPQGGPGYGPPQGAPGYGAPPGPGGMPVSAFGAGPAAQPFQFRPPTSGGFNPLVALLVVGPVVLLVGISVIVGVVVSAKKKAAAAAAYRTSSTYGSTSSSYATGTSATAALADKVLMDTWTEPPLVADVNGDGTEDVVARFTSFEGGKARLYVGAFDGETYKKVWRVGPVGDLGAESAATRTALVGKHLLVADSRATLHVYAVAGGAELGTVKLTDRAERIYASPDGKEAWIKMTDTKDVVFDDATRTVKAAAYPSWMPEKLKFPDSFDCDLALRNTALKAKCAPRRTVPAIPSFNPTYALVDGDDAIALGVRTPGTRAPMIAGFDPKAKKARWSSPISGDKLGVQEGAPRAADLVGDRLVVGWSTTSGDGRLAAFDAKSGNKLWEAQIARAAPLFLTATANRVYLPATSAVRVYDAKRGTLLGTLGTP